MTMLRMIAVVACVLVLAVPAAAAVKTKTVTYKHGDLECKGFLAYDDAVEGKRPGVLVVHEFWGLNDYAKMRAKKLAELGYVAFCADLYGEGKHTEHPDDARKMATTARENKDDWRKRAEDALETLKAQPQCDSSRLAAIGYCFGGSTVLQLAYAGADLKAVASFHGGLSAQPTEEDVKRIKPFILVCHGGADTFIPQKDIKAFREAMDNGGVKYEFISYPGATHSFTVPDADKHGVPGLKYDKKADEASWERMQEVFKKEFGK
jgi:dienelactone hydrolase